VRGGNLIHGWRRAHDAVAEFALGDGGAISNHGVAFQPKADPHFHLESQIARFAHRAANIADLEPVNVPNCLSSFGYCVANRLLHAVVGHADYLDYFVRFIRHRSLLCVRYASFVRDVLPLLLLYSEYPPARKHRAWHTLANYLNVLPQV
jgi:hypothetical protein